ncbi:c-type cytochrome [Chitinibacter sp. S2-10]|uniref:c-type cytochrome n=1 Tax=Chitinibacter sp. S2-10 TaxID=3373597 RepID=UPI0039773B54
MGGSNATASKSVAGMVLAALIGVPLVVYLLIKLFTSGMNTNLTSSTMTNEAVAARLQAVGTVKVVEGGDAPPGARTGKNVYDGVCIACHGEGLAGSPKFGDAAAWGSRIAQGFDTLSKHALNGLNAMPAKGGAPDLSDDELKRAVAYMANAAGAKFQEPAIAVAAGADASEASAAGK